MTCVLCFVYVCRWRSRWRLMRRGACADADKKTGLRVDGVPTAYTNKPCTVFGGPESFEFSSVLPSR